MVAAEYHGMSGDYRIKILEVWLCVTLVMAASVAAICAGSSFCCSCSAAVAMAVAVSRPVIGIAAADEKRGALRGTLFALFCLPGCWICIVGAHHDAPVQENIPFLTCAQRICNIHHRAIWNRPYEYICNGVITPNLFIWRSLPKDKNVVY